MIRTYEELIEFSTFEERFDYLKLDGMVGQDTFGFDRYLNQIFYKSKEWKAVKDYVIIRDLGCDLASEGYEIRGRIIVHHMNPVQVREIIDRSRIILDPRYLISTSHNTHNAIHYGDRNLLVLSPVIRKPNDTCPWKH